VNTDELPAILITAPGLESLNSSTYHLLLTILLHNIPGTLSTGYYQEFRRIKTSKAKYFVYLPCEM